MFIIGCDLHTRHQEIAMLNTETGELVERRLEHENGQAKEFYAGLPRPVRAAVAQGSRLKPCGSSRFFLRWNMRPGVVARAWKSPQSLPCLAKYLL